MHHKWVQRVFSLHEAKHHDTQQNCNHFVMKEVVGHNDNLDGNYSSRKAVRVAATG